MVRFASWPLHGICLLVVIRLPLAGGEHRPSTRHAAGKKVVGDARQQLPEDVQSLMRGPPERSFVIHKMPLASQAARESQLDAAGPYAPSAGLDRFADFQMDAAPRFWCSRDDQVVADKAMKNSEAPTRAVNDLCLLGITKFGWACILTALAMLTLIMCIPLVLAISRRRPPGVSFFSCFNKGMQHHLPPAPPVQGLISHTPRP
mmetsp:Transcript_128128/g.221036  ORF Transcript_128128/g.221036 Transcript_128128/m.221036 type:complete len:204 (-) Transcript_128128:39-650(-)